MLINWSCVFDFKLQEHFIIEFLEHFERLEMHWCFLVSFLQILYNIVLANDQCLEKASEKVTQFFIKYFESIFETNDKFNNAFLLIKIFEFLKKKD